ncbi:hypothetical protein LJK87_03615 [Paenibacillus sp. P25]|nr:hypothetical protein LJK87_03615 [Paenibacillus sp. P25]
MDRYPFAYDHSRPFIEQVSAWIADVFYDVLPESGFEVRDEQIYMAFQLERAFAEKQTIFAEAGVGTGKTLVYLLYAVCYARYHRKPVIIACADESLIEQLVKSEGDIAKLAEHLHMKIDARLGKSLDQYACLVKLDEARLGHEEPGLYQEIYEGLPEFVRNPGTLQAFHAYGDRKHYPHLTDAQWSKIGWDTFQDCFVCDKRHRAARRCPGNITGGRRILSSARTIFIWSICGHTKAGNGRDSRRRCRSTAPLSSTKVICWKPPPRRRSLTS